MLRLLSVIALVAIAVPADAAVREGAYSRQAVVIWDQIAGPGRPLTVHSPGGESRVVATYDEKTDDGRVLLHTSGQIGRGLIDLGAGVGAELLWARNGRAFLVTTSDGGANGPFRTMLVDGHSGRPRARDLSPLIYRAFGHPVECGWPERPNVGAVTWLSGTRVVVAAEIVAHSNCDSFGTFAAYEVDVEGMRVVRRIDQVAAKRIFARELGQELAAAPDQCIRTPSSCWVATNHPHGSEGKEPSQAK